MSKSTKKVFFFKIGGTWDMIIKKGRLEGDGILDDETLWKFEEKLDYFKKGARYKNIEWKLAKQIYDFINLEAKKTCNLEDHLKFVPNIKNLVSGDFASIFSGDSSHLRTSLIAPIITFLLKKAVLNPNIPILGAQGTDTADISLLPLLDVYTFDTNLSPFILTGSNKSFREKDSDAPGNFTNLFKIANANLPSGAYWVFGSYVFPASDLIKISPLESRVIESFSTFYSPHLRAQTIQEVLKTSRIKPLENKIKVNHVINNLELKDLFKAISNVQVIDLGLQDELDFDIEKIINPNSKAIVIAGHSFGNVSNPIKYACEKAAASGKLVIITSRCLISDVKERYGASILHVNKDSLYNSGKKIISAHKLNKSISRALAIRAIHENLSQDKTQKLFDDYSISRDLSDYDVITA